MAALARGFSDRHFERGEGPGDEVAPYDVLRWKKALIEEKKFIMKRNHFSTRFKVHKRS